MTERTPKLYSLLDVAEPTPFGPRSHGRMRGMLLLAAATQTAACAGVEPSRPDQGTSDQGFITDGLPAYDGGTQGFTDGLSPYDGAPDRGVDDTDAGSDAGGEDTDASVDGG